MSLSLALAQFIVLPLQQADIEGRRMRSTLSGRSGHAKRGAPYAAQAQAPRGTGGIVRIGVGLVVGEEETVNMKCVLDKLFRVVVLIRG